MALVAAAIFPTVGMGAECALPSGVAIDRPVQIGTQCKFYDAAENDRVERYTGRAVIDLGRGKVVQGRLRESDCVRQEMIVFTDCNAGQSIMISGVDVSNGAVPTTYSIRAAQVSGGGPIAISHDVTVEGLRAVAYRHKIGYSDTVDGFGRNRTPVSCGCQLYYPNSRGARR